MQNMSAIISQLKYTSKYSQAYILKLLFYAILFISICNKHLWLYMEKKTTHKFELF